MKFKSLIRIISIVLVICFTGQDVLAYAPSLTPAAVPLMPRVNFLLKDSVASIDDGFTPASAKDRSPQVILFQDAHTNASGQFNLAKALGAVIRAEGIDRVYSEGGWGDCSLGGLKGSADPRLLRDAAGRYVRKGILHGEEYLSLTSDLEFKILGAEEQALYAQGLRAYAVAAEKRREAMGYLDRMRRGLSDQAPMVFGPDLARFEAARERYQNGQLPFTRWFDTLISRAEKTGIYLDNYGALRELRRITKLEKKIGSDPSRHPAFMRHLRHLKKSLRLSAPDILNELAQLETDVMDRTALTVREKLLIELKDDASLIEKLIKLQITPKEYEKLEAQGGLASAGPLSGFVNARILEREAGYEGAIPLRKELASAEEAAKHFYDLAADRDWVFLDAIQKRMSEAPDKPVVLITGGFHTFALKDRLREKGISFVSILPRVKEETDQARYERLLLAQLKSTEAGAPHDLTPKVQNTAQTLRTLLLALNPAAQSALAAEAGRAMIPSKLSLVTPTPARQSAEPASAAARMAKAIRKWTTGFHENFRVYWFRPNSKWQEVPVDADADAVDAMVDPIHVEGAILFPAIGDTIVTAFFEPTYSFGVSRRISRFRSDHLIFNDIAYGISRNRVYYHHPGFLPKGQFLPALMRRYEYFRGSQIRVAAKGSNKSSAWITYEIKYATGQTQKISFVSGPASWFKPSDLGLQAVGMVFATNMGWNNDLGKSRSFWESIYDWLVPEGLVYATHSPPIFSTTTHRPYGNWRSEEPEKVLFRGIGPQLYKVTKSPGSSPVGDQSTGARMSDINEIEIQLTFPAKLPQTTLRALIKMNELQIRGQGVEEPYAPVTYSVSSSAGLSSGWISNLDEVLDKPISKPTEVIVGYHKILKPVRPIRTILVAEDDPDVQARYRRLFTRDELPAGIQVTYAKDGAKVLARMSDPGQPEIDLLITDVHMPGLNGDDLIKRIRRQGNTLPVIVVSGTGLFRSRNTDPQYDPYVNVRTLGKSPQDFADCVTLVKDTIRRSLGARMAEADAVSGDFSEEAKQFVRPQADGTYQPAEQIVTGPLMGSRDLLGRLYEAKGHPGILIKIYDKEAEMGMTQREGEVLMAISRALRSGELSADSGLVAGFRARVWHEGEERWAIMMPRLPLPDAYGEWVAMSRSDATRIRNSSLQSAVAGASVTPPNIRMTNRSDQLEFALATARALKALHELGWLHRDVKPRNILSHRKADGHLQVFLVDYELASPVGAVSGGSGTLGYRPILDIVAAPEKEPNLTASYFQDVYGLAGTLWDLWYGAAWTVPAWNGDPESGRQELEHLFRLASRDSTGNGLKQDLADLYIGWSNRWQRQHPIEPFLIQTLTTPGSLMAPDGLDMDHFIRSLEAALSDRIGARMAKVDVTDLERQQHQKYDRLKAELQKSFELMSYWDGIRRTASWGVLPAIALGLWQLYLIAWGSGLSASFRQQVLQDPWAILPGATALVLFAWKMIAAHMRSRHFHNYYVVDQQLDEMELRQIASDRTDESLSEAREEGHDGTRVKLSALLPQKLGDRELRVDQGHRVFRNDGRFFRVDDETANNLNLFRVEDDRASARDYNLFNKLDRTRTLYGQTRLDWLAKHPLLDAAEIRSGQEAVAELLERQLDRERIRSAFGDDQQTGSTLMHFAQDGNPFDFKAARRFVWIKRLFMAAAVVAAFCVPPAFAFVGGFVVYGFLCRMFWGVRNREIPLHADTKNFLKVAVGLQARLRSMNPRSGLLREILAEFDHALRDDGPAAAFLKRPSFAAAQTLFNADRQAMARLLSAAAELDCLASQAEAVIDNLGYHAFPEPVESAETFLEMDLQEAHHPLILMHRSVSNDMRLDRNHFFALITGHNEGGKSTSIRDLVMQLYLAQIRMPVRAAGMRWSPMRFITLMNILDDQQRGRSTFRNEAERLAFMMRSAADHPGILLAFDEMFRGTNPADRERSQRGTVRMIREMGALGIMATHDLGLTDMAVNIPGVQNFHVVPSEDGNGSTYKIAPGPATTTNALAVLESAGAPPRLMQLIREPDDAGARMANGNGNGHGDEGSSTLEGIVAEMHKLIPLQKWPAAVTVFGSARIKTGNLFYELAVELGELLAREGYPVRTGAGPSMMLYPFEGVIRVLDDPMFRQGIRIDGLPFEQFVNPLVGVIEFFNYFLTRKRGLHENAIAMVALPGGIGSVDEFFESWRRGRPIGLLSKAFWGPVLQQLKMSWKQAGIFDQVIGRGDWPFLSDHPRSIVDFIAHRRNSAEYFGHFSTPPTRIEALIVELVSSHALLHEMARAVTFVGTPPAMNPALIEAKRLAGFLWQRGTDVRAASRGNLLESLARAERDNGQQHLLQKVMFAPPPKGFAAPPARPRSAGPGRGISVKDESVHQFLTASNSSAYVFLPGGVGTMNRLFDIMQIIQVQKARKKPVLLMGRDFWLPIMQRLGEAWLSTAGLPQLVNSEDMKIFSLVNTAEEALAVLDAAKRSGTSDTAGSRMALMPVKEIKNWMDVVGQLDRIAAALASGEKFEDHLRYIESLSLWLRLNRSKLTLTRSDDRGALEIYPDYIVEGPKAALGRIIDSLQRSGVMPKYNHAIKELTTALPYYSSTSQSTQKLNELWRASRYLDEALNPDPEEMPFPFVHSLREHIHRAEFSIKTALEMMDLYFEYHRTGRMRDLGYNDPIIQEIKSTPLPARGSDEDQDLHRIYSILRQLSGGDRMGERRLSDQDLAGWTEHSVVIGHPELAASIQSFSSFDPASYQERWAALMRIRRIIADLTQSAAGTEVIDLHQLNQLFGSEIQSLIHDIYPEDLAILAEVPGTLRLMQDLLRNLRQNDFVSTYLMDWAEALDYSELTYSELYNVLYVIGANFGHHLRQWRAEYQQAAEDVFPGQPVEMERAIALVEKEKFSLRATDALLTKMRHLAAEASRTDPHGYVYSDRAQITQALRRPFSPRVRIGQNVSSANSRVEFGGKGKFLSDTVRMGMPVPSAFILGSSVGAHGDHIHNPEEFDRMLNGEIAWLESDWARVIGRPVKLGDADHPLFVSVRSGSMFVMPGILKTYVNLGHTPQILEAEIARRGPEEAYGSYLRFIESIASLLADEMPQSGYQFESEIKNVIQMHIYQAGPGATGVSGPDLRQASSAVEEVLKVISKHGLEARYSDLYRNPREQIRRAVRNTWNSWMDPRAVSYRKARRISDDWQTPVLVQAYVAGDMGINSGTGVGRSHTQKGEQKLDGEWVPVSQGFDHVQGRRPTKTLDVLRMDHPAIYNEIDSYIKRLEAHYGRPIMVEYTVEDGRLWLLQVSYDHRNQNRFKYPEFIIPDSQSAAGSGFTVFGEGGMNVVVADDLDDLSIDLAIEAMREDPRLDGVAVVRSTSDPDDTVRFLKINQALGVYGKRLVILTQFGGLTSHASVTAQMHNIPAVVGIQGLVVDRRQSRLAGRQLFPGDRLGVDLSYGRVYIGTFDKSITSRSGARMAVDKSPANAERASDEDAISPAERLADLWAWLAGPAERIPGNADSWWLFSSGSLRAAREMGAQWENFRRNDSGKDIPVLILGGVSRSSPTLEEIKEHNDLGDQRFLDSVLKRIDDQLNLFMSLWGHDQTPGKSQFWKYMNDRYNWSLDPATTPYWEKAYQGVEFTPDEIKAPVQKRVLNRLIVPATRYRTRIPEALVLEAVLLEAGVRKDFLRMDVTAASIDEQIRSAERILVPADTAVVDKAGFEDVRKLGGPIVISHQGFAQRRIVGTLAALLKNAIAQKRLSGTVRLVNVPIVESAPKGPAGESAAHAVTAEILQHLTTVRSYDGERTVRAEVPESVAGSAAIMRKYLRAKKAGLRAEEAVIPEAAAQPATVSETRETVFYLDFSFLKHKFPETVQKALKYFAAKQQGLKASKKLKKKPGPDPAVGESPIIQVEGDGRITDLREERGRFGGTRLRVTWDTTGAEFTSLGSLVSQLKLSRELRYIAEQSRPPKGQLPVHKQTWNETPRSGDVYHLAKKGSGRIFYRSEDTGADGRSLDQDRSRSGFPGTFTVTSPKKKEPSAQKVEPIQPPTSGLWNIGVTQPTPAQQAILDMPLRDFMRRLATPRQMAMGHWDQIITRVIGTIGSDPDPKVADLSRAYVIYGQTNHVEKRFQVLQALAELGIHWGYLTADNQAIPEATGVGLSWEELLPVAGRDPKVDKAIGRFQRNGETFGERTVYDLLRLSPEQLYTGANRMIQGQELFYNFADALLERRVIWGRGFSFGPPASQQAGARMAQQDAWIREVVFPEYSSPWAKPADNVEEPVFPYLVAARRLSEWLSRPEFKVEEIQQLDPASRDLLAAGALVDSTDSWTVIQQDQDAPVSGSGKSRPIKKGPRGKQIEISYGINRMEQILSQAPIAKTRIRDGLIPWKGRNTSRSWAAWASQNRDQINQQFNHLNRTLQSLDRGGYEAYRGAFAKKAADPATIVSASSPEPASKAFADHQKLVRWIDWGLRETSARELVRIIIVDPGLAPEHRAVFDRLAVLGVLPADHAAWLQEAMRIEKLFFEDGQFAQGTVALKRLKMFAPLYRVYFMQDRSLDEAIGRIEQRLNADATSHDLLTVLSDGAAGDAKQTQVPGNAKKQAVRLMNEQFLSEHPDHPRWGNFRAVLPVSATGRVDFRIGGGGPGGLRIGHRIVFELGRRGLPSGTHVNLTRTYIPDRGYFEFDLQTLTPEGKESDLPNRTYRIARNADGSPKKDTAGHYTTELVVAKDEDYLGWEKGSAALTEHLGRLKNSPDGIGELAPFEAFYRVHESGRLTVKGPKTPQVIFILNFKAGQKIALARSSRPDPVYTIIGLDGLGLPEGDPQRFKLSYEPGATRVRAVPIDPIWVGEEKIHEQIIRHIDSKDPMSPAIGAFEGLIFKADQGGRKQFGRRAAAGTSGIRAIFYGLTPGQRYELARVWNDGQEEWVYRVRPIDADGKLVASSESWYRLRREGEPQRLRQSWPAPEFKQASIDLKNAMVRFTPAGARMAVLRPNPGALRTFASRAAAAIGARPGERVTFAILGDDRKVRYARARRPRLGRTSEPFERSAGSQTVVSLREADGTMLQDLGLNALKNELQALPTVAADFELPGWAELFPAETHLTPDEITAQIEFLLAQITYFIRIRPGTRFFMDPDVSTLQPAAQEMIRRAIRTAGEAQLSFGSAPREKGRLTIRTTTSYTASAGVINLAVDPITRGDEMPVWAAIFAIPLMAAAAAVDDLADQADPQEAFNTASGFVQKDWANRAAAFYDKDAFAGGVAGGEFLEALQGKKPFLARQRPKYGLVLASRMLQEIRSMIQRVRVMA